MLQDVFGSKESWQEKVERTIDNLKNAHFSALSKIEKEQKERDTSDQRIYKSLKKQIADLKDETVQALEEIKQSLIRLDAPPSREEAPVLQDIQQRLAIVEEGLNHLQRKLRA